MKFHNIPRVNFRKNKMVSHTPSSILWTAQVVGNKDSIDENWGVKKSGYDIFLNENLRREALVQKQDNNRKKNNSFDKLLCKADETINELNLSCGLHSLLGPDSLENG